MMRAVTGLVVCLMFVFSAAATEYVVPGGAGDPTSGSGWAHAWSNVQDAVDNADAGGEEIWIKKGKYAVSSAIVIDNRVDLELYGGFAGSETLLIQRDSVTNVTVLDGGDASILMWVTNSPSSNIRIDGLVFAEAFRAAGNGAALILQDITHVTVDNCVFLQNQAYARGSGIQLYNCDSSTIEDCLFTRNSLGKSFEDGAGIFEGNGSDLNLIQRCTFVGNLRSGYFSYSAGASTRIENCLITGNIGHLGGIAFSQSSPDMWNCTIAYNSAQAGGVACSWSCGALIYNCVIANNFPYGISEQKSNSDPYVRDCLIFDNVTGGFYDNDTGSNYTSAADINTLVSPADRTSDNVVGHPRFARGPLGTWTSLTGYDDTVKQTVLVDTNASFTPGELAGLILNPDTAFSAYYHLKIVDNTETSITVWADCTSWVAGDEAYQVYDFHIMHGSAAIDQAPSASAPTADMDGNARPYDVADQGNETTDTLDLGAYELQTDREIIYVAPGGAGSGNGDSWGNAMSSVQSAVDTAFDRYGDDVWVKEGTFSISTPLGLASAIRVYGSFAGSESTVDDRDFDSHVTILDGGGANRVIETSNKDAWRFDGFLVCGGASGTGGGGGGGLFTACSEAVIDNCRVLDNTAKTGAGFYMVDCGGLIVEDSLFTQNNIDGNYGHGIAMAFGSCDAGNTVSRCLFVGQSGNANGGALSFYGWGINGDVVNCVFSGNQTRYGGGMNLAQTSSSLTIRSCTFAFNRGWQPAGGAGAIYANYSCSAKIRDCVFGYNADGSFYEDSTGSDPTFENNLCFGSPGDGIFYDYDNGWLTTAAAVNSGCNPAGQAFDNLEGNPKFKRVPGSDDGTWTSRDAYNTVTKQTTLHDTLASFAPGSLADSIICPDTAAGLYRHAVVASNSATSITVWGDVTSWVAGNEGYRFYDYRLSPESAAENAASTNAQPSVDFNGNPRPQHGGYDIGAYEKAPPKGSLFILF